MPASIKPPSDHLEAKQSIGRSVARLIPVGAHVALSGGSTTLEAVARPQGAALPGRGRRRRPRHRRRTGGDPRLRVVCTGGEVQPRYHTLAGTVTERVLKLHFFDFAVIGVSGIDLRHGFTVNSQVEAATVNLIAEHAAHGRGSRRQQ